MTSDATVQAAVFRQWKNGQ